MNLCYKIVKGTFYYFITLSAKCTYMNVCISWVATLYAERTIYPKVLLVLSLALFQNLN